MQPSKIKLLNNIYFYGYFGLLSRQNGVNC